jgi:hypothetical protein
LTSSFEGAPMKIENGELVNTEHNIKITSAGIFFKRLKMIWSEDNFFYFPDANSKSERGVPLPNNLGANTTNSQNNRQIKQLKAIIKHNFPGVFPENSLQCQFTISEETYTVNLQNNNISYETSVGTSPVITVKIKENDDLFYADFQNFYILFVKNSMNIEKHIKNDDFIMALFKKNLSMRRQEPIWDSDFSEEFETVIQGKEYEGVMNRSFQHKKYTSGFNLYKFSGDQNQHLLIIKGRNEKNSVDIFSIIFYNGDIYLNIQQNQPPIFKKNQENNLLFAVFDTEIYIIDLISNQIFKHDGKTLFRLIWEQRGFYNWESLGSQNKNANSVQKIINSLQRRGVNTARGAAAAANTSTIRQQQPGKNSSSAPLQIRVNTGAANARGAEERLGAQ